MVTKVPATVVFAVTSTGRDVYTAMTRLAAASLRATNAGVRLVVACDQGTDAALKAAREPLLSEIDEWIVVPTPSGSPDFRNRFVRTRLRASLSGPFVFLDSDVLVRGDLGELFQMDVDMAAAANHSRAQRSEQVSREDTEILTAMDWAVRPDVYFNAGVLFINDTPMARSCCADWHERWLLSAVRSRRPRDQPALNAAIHATGPRTAILPARFNAQFRNTISVARDAVVWHYYSPIHNAGPARFELAAQRLVEGEALEAVAVSSMIRSPHPWRRTTPIDDLAAGRILARGRFDGWAALWLRREFGAALKRRLARTFEWR